MRAPQESDLLAEKTAMSWLQGKLNVPRVVCFHEKGDIQYLLMTQITGVSGIHQDAKNDIPRLVRMFARGLREIHAIAVDSCPLDWRMERYFAWATDLIDSGALDGQIPDGETRNVLRNELDSIRGRPATRGPGIHPWGLLPTQRYDPQWPFKWLH